MSNHPFRTLTIASCVSSYLLVGYRPNWVLSGYVGTFVQLWLVGLCLYAVWKMFLEPNFFSSLRHLPGPKGGSFWNGQFGRIQSEPTGAPMLEWVQSVPNDGIIRYLGIFNSERLLIVSPKALSDVLTTRSYDFIKPDLVRRSLGRILGNGLLMAEGDEHRMQRKNLMPAFAFRHVKNLYPLFWQKSREAVQAITAVIKSDASKATRLDVGEKTSNLTKDTTVIEVGEWVSRATLDIIGIAGLGQDFCTLSEPDSELNRTYRKVFTPSREAKILGILNLFLPGWFVRNLPVKRNGEMEAASAYIKSVCRKVIRTKMEKLDKNELTDVDILSVALESGGFSEDNLVDQLMTFLAAGHETTATATTWAIYMLCLHPDVQTRLRAEIRENLPSIQDETDPTSQEIDRLSYLHAVCSEVLRYYAPVPLTVRDASADTMIAGQAIRKGTRIMIVPWAINRHEELWGPDAGKFNPERWLPSENNPQYASGGAKSNYANMTFLHGPRSCIGQGFSKAEFACLLAALIGRFEFELNDPKEMDEKNMIIKGGVTTKPAHGLHVKVAVVDGW